jgi:hypothetical protein
MADRTRVAWGGAAGSLVLTCIIQADRLAKFFGIINIPKDTRETMSALASAPTHLSVGILIIGGACVVYLYLEHLKSLKRRFWNPKLDLLTVGLLGLVVFAGVTALGLYRQLPSVTSVTPQDDFVKNTAGPPIEWRFDKPVTIFMYSRKPGDAVRVDAVWIHATNNGDYALKSVKAGIRSDLKSELTPMRVNPHGIVMPPDKSAAVIPAKTDFDLTLEVEGGPLTAEQFMREYGTLYFVFEYERNGRAESYSQQFPLSYIEDQVSFIEEKTKDQRLGSSLQKRTEAARRSPNAQLIFPSEANSEVEHSSFKRSWTPSAERPIEERERGADSKFPNIRLADNEVLKNMLGGDERKKLIGLLQSGDLTAWAYVRGKADLMPLENRLWSLYELELANIDGKPQTLFRHPSEYKSKRPWAKAPVEPNPELTRIYDVHLNKAQLRSNWPEMFSG